MYTNEELARNAKKLAMPSPPTSDSAQKRRSPSSCAKVLVTRRSPPLIRCAGGLVSGSSVATSTMASSAAMVIARNTARQPSGTISALPASGAKIGDTLNTSITRPISRVAAMPVCRSRTTARGITVTAAAPMPCSSRQPISQPISGERLQPSAPSANNARPK